MKNTPEDNLLLILTSRTKFWEKNYFDLYHQFRSVLCLKPQDLQNPSKLSSFKENLKILPHPNPSSELHTETLVKLIEATKDALSSAIEPSDTHTQILSIFEKFSVDLINFTSGKLSEKLQTYKPLNTTFDKTIKNTEKKLAAFQKEARKPPSDRKSEFRALTPVRSSINRSISPADRRTHSLSQENLDLKDQLKKLQDERDILKAWKENVLKLPGNFSEDPNALFKENEVFKKQLVTGNKVLVIKIQTMAAAVFKFLKDTAVSQKVSREKEGFAAVNFYENEKYKLEVKIKELADLKDVQLVSCESPEGKWEVGVDFLQYGERVLFMENENKGLRNQLREMKKVVKGLEIRCAELENGKWQAEKEKGILERKNRNSNTPTNGKKGFSMISKQIELVRVWAESRVVEISSFFESKLEEITQKLQEKETSVIYLRTLFTQNLKENLNLLITMNENIRNSNTDKPYDEVLKSQVENFEYIIEQHKTYTEIKIKELNETIESLENERKHFVKKVKGLENENFHLKVETNKLKDVEDELKAAKNVILELEAKVLASQTRLRAAKQREMEYGQVRYENSVLAAEVSRISEECAQKDKAIIEMQQTIASEQMQANKCFEELLFKEKAAKSELEMLKIELANYKSEVNALEQQNQELKENPKPFKLVN